MLMMNLLAESFLAVECSTCLFGTWKSLTHEFSRIDHYLWSAHRPVHSTRDRASQSFTAESDGIDQIFSSQNAYLHLNPSATFELHQTSCRRVGFPRVR
ncbi:hypothetical protein ARMGADRAFT_86297 [Armillaria gallica]|uniref:Secreted protein n=1 Tax=Armillaria gallica TaxID=47427 RepID=A0A2H3CFM4_ARMGA|nr:hypothetical protein ARMGADRAFT_86297 [Armillaria gallica]